MGTKLHISTQEYRAYGKLSKLIHDHLSASLKNLRTTYVDLYYLHRYNEDIDIEDVASVMKEWLDEGLIRGRGLSQVGVDLLQSAHETTPVSAVQNLYNMMERDCEKEVIPYCLNHHIGVVPFSPIASCFLSGKVDASTKFEGDDVRKFVPQLLPENITANQAFLDVISKYAREFNATNTQIALAWMLKKNQYRTNPWLEKQRTDPGKSQCPSNRIIGSDIQRAGNQSKCTYRPWSSRDQRNPTTFLLQ